MYILLQREAFSCKHGCWWISTFSGIAWLSRLHLLINYCLCNWFVKCTPNNSLKNTLPFLNLNLFAKADKIIFCQHVSHWRVNGFRLNDNRHKLRSPAVQLATSNQPRHITRIQEIHQVQMKQPVGYAMHMKGSNFYLAKIVLTNMHDINLNMTRVPCTHGAYAYILLLH